MNNLSKSALLILALVTSILLFCFFKSGKGNYFYTESQHEPSWYNTISIPPSPTASSLGKFGEFPVDKSTGVPAIEIPLYKINYGGITVPIALSYHASGIKVQEEESWVGTGWSLDAGGVITRVMRNRPDEEAQKGFIYCARKVPTKSYVDGYSYNNCPLVDSLRKLAENELDMEPDIFYYNFSSHAGSFNFDNRCKIAVNDTVLSVLSRPYEKIRITPKINSSGLYFKVTDTDGNIYLFDQREKTKLIFHNLPITEELVYISSWYLSSIENPRTGKKIHFNYYSPDSESKENDINISENKYFYYLDGSYHFRSQVFPIYSHSVTLNEKVLYGINYGENSSETTNIAFSSSPIYNHHSSLSSIEININNECKRSYSFYYSVSQNGSSLDRTSFRTYLEGVHFSEGSDFEKYSFSYYGSLPSRSSYAIDHWGYYNGANNNLTLIPPQVLGNQTFSGANREPQWPYTQSGTLSKITYPTGGYSDFQYESNKYSSSNLTGGGIRIKQITSHDRFENKDLIKNFDYNNSGYLTMGLPQYSRETRKYYCNQNIFQYIDEVTFSSSPVTGLGASSNSVAYRTVTEYNGDESSNAGKVETQYPFIYDDRQELSSVSFPFISNQWQRTKVQKEITFKSRIENNILTYDTVLVKSYSYKLTPDTITKGFKVVRIGYKPSYPDSLQCYITCSPLDFDYNNFNIYSENWLLNKTSEKQYSPYPEQTRIENITYNLYDSINWKQIEPVIIKKYNSNGDLNITRYTYPVDNVTLDNAIYYMRLHNMISTPLQQQFYSNGIERQKYIWNFAISDNKLHLSSAEEYISTGTSQTQKTVMSYENYDDYGNPVQVIGKDGIRTSFKWGYGNELLLAEAKNCQAKDFFYTSFEESGGNSADGDSYTGRRSFIESNGIKYTASLTGLTPGPYYLTYFKKPSNSEWNYFVENITVNNTGSVNLEIGGQVDEIRFYPKTALLTTLTYDPASGVTSVSQPNGLTTFYEYNSLGKLVCVRDNRKHILTFLEYKYNPLGVIPIE